MTSDTPSRRGSLPLGIVLGVVAGAIAVMFAWFAVVDDPDTATPAPAPSAEVTPSPEPTPEVSPEPSPTVEATPAPDPTPAPTVEPTPVHEVTPTEQPEEEPSHPDIVTELPTGSWITVLASLPKEVVTAEQALERARQESRPGHEAVVIDTNAFPGLNPGYWAVVIPGADSREASNEVCRAIGIPVSDACYPREIAS